MDSNAWLIFPAAWAAVLGVAAVAKLRTPSETREALDALPLPTVVRRLGGSPALPMMELAVAALLVLGSDLVYRVASLALLLIAITYLWVIVSIWRLKDSVRCACFGALSGGEVTGTTVARNILLLIGAGAALVWWNQPSSVAWAILTDSTTWPWLAGVLWLAVMTTMLGIRQRVEGRFERSPIPADASIIDGQRNTHSLRDLAHEQARLLVFLSTGCAPCHTVASSLPAWTQELWPIAVHAIVPVPETRAEFAALEPILWTADASDSAARAFEITATPAVVLLGTDGLVAGGPLEGGHDEIAAFVTAVKEQTKSSGSSPRR